MLLVATAVFILFTGAYMDHKHTGRFFKKSEEEPTEVVLSTDSTVQLARSMSDAVLPVIGGVSFASSGNGSNVRIRGGPCSDQASRDVNVVITEK
jgi:hypothetical protein